MVLQDVFSSLRKPTRLPDDTCLCSTEVPADAHAFVVKMRIFARPCLFSAEGAFPPTCLRQVSSTLNPKP